MTKTTALSNLYQACVEQARENRKKAIRKGDQAETIRNTAIMTLCQRLRDLAKKHG